MSGEYLLRAVRNAARQEQFLDVVSPEEATRRFHAQLRLAPLEAETVALENALGRVLAHNVAAPIDVPSFDRSTVDGFAVRAADTSSASEAVPLRLRLNAEVTFCGHAPTIEIAPGTATTIATGGMIPRGADSVIMIEHAELIDLPQVPEIEIRRPAAPGQFVSYAGSDIARGETLLRSGSPLTSREIGVLAACGLACCDVVRKPKVAVLSTGDELVPAGTPLRVAAVYDSNGPILAAAVKECGGEPVNFGVVADNEAKLQASLQSAMQDCDIIVLSGGTSKGAGDLSHRILSRLEQPGILVHGVALKPGKPLCLAVAGTKPIVVLPGFPTSAIFTFHAFVAPLIRAYAGLPKEEASKVEARIPVHIPSELGRTEFVLVSLVRDKEGNVAFPTVKGSGAVTGFSQADGFIEIDALANAADAGSIARVTLIGNVTRAPDLVLTGSHDVALDIVIDALTQQGYSTRTIAVGSQGGVAAASRGECDLAPVHLIDPKSGTYNNHLVSKGISLVKGWQRMQGVLFRRGDRRFEDKSPQDAIASALADEACLMVNRNAGAGTRILIDRMLAGQRPQGYANQPKSHNAVAAAIAQSRADWGIAVETVATLYGLGFLPITPEDYDFLLVDERHERAAVRAFLALLADAGIQRRLEHFGMKFPDRTSP